MSTTAETMDMDEFLGHETRGESQSNYLRWRKGKEIVVWLHTGARITALWQNAWPKVVEYKDKETQDRIRAVFGDKFNSWEPASILRNQFRRNRDTGERDQPPTICPMSLMIEEVHRLVRTDKVKWIEPLFHFEGDDPKKAQTLRAGGLYNAFGNRNLTDQQKREMRTEGISPMTAWQQNCQAKCNYLFQVVDHEKPDEGLQIALETTLLGDKFKDVVRKYQKMLEKQGKDPRDGNPMRVPWAMLWEYDQNASEFHKRYDVTRMESLELPDAVRAVICDSEPIDVDHITKRGNAAKLRLSMETGYVGPAGLLDFGKIFKVAEEVEAKEKATDETGDALDNVVADGQDRKPAAEAERDTPIKVGSDEAATGDKTPLADGEVECGECGMAVQPDSVCGNCGFDPSNTEAPPPTDDDAPPVEADDDVGF